MLISVSQYFLPYEDKSSTIWRSVDKTTFNSVSEHLAASYLDTPKIDEFGGKQTLRNAYTYLPTDT
jgi:hypothetical protein